MITLGKIDKVLVHTVDVVRVTTASGSRSTVTTENVPARIANRTRIVRDGEGDRFVSQTVVYMKPGADVLKDDDLIVDSEQFPVTGIIKARDGKGVMHHLEVLL